MDGDAQVSPRLPALRLSQPWHRLEEPASPAPASDQGFDNPVFSVVSHHCQGPRGLLGALTLLKASWGDPDRGRAFQARRGLWDMPVLPRGTSHLLKDSVLGGFCQGFASLPHGLFFLPCCCRSLQMLTLERRYQKISRFSTSTLCTMQARQRPDGVDSC